jgi:hypothetical protein
MVSSRRKISRYSLKLVVVFLGSWFLVSIWAIIMCRTGTELAPLYSRIEQGGELNTFKTPATTGLTVLSESRNVRDEVTTTGHTLII